ncbi:MAG: hypothetical protein LBU79_05845 [Planctomycetota bacterium]|jgi:TRAP transporter TAXI family solute receptor|nr:hypothetical protein [Planctomycetota bacterium]
MFVTRRFLTSTLSFTLSLLFALLTQGVWAAASELGWPGDLHVVTGPKGGQWFTIGEAMGKIFTANGIPTRSFIGGGTDNLKLVGDEKADIAFTFYSILGENEIRTGKKYTEDGKAILWAKLYPQVLYVVVKKDIGERLGLFSLKDILTAGEGFRVAFPSRGSGSEFLLNQLLRYGYRTDYQQLQNRGWAISFQNHAETQRLFQAGEIDACIYTSGPGNGQIPTLMENDPTGRLLSIDAGALEIMSQRFYTFTYTFRPDDHRNLTKEVDTLGDYSCLVANSSLPDELLYRISELIWTNREQLTRVADDLKYLNPKLAVAGNCQIHPGALSFWNTLSSEGVGVN